MRYDIVFDPGGESYWLVDQDSEEWVAGPFDTGAEAELMLAAYLHDEPPENDLEP